VDGFLRNPFLSEMGLQKAGLSWILRSWGAGAGSLELLWEQCGWQCMLSGRCWCPW